MALKLRLFLLILIVLISFGISGITASHASATPYAVFTTCPTAVYIDTPTPGVLNSDNTPALVASNMGAYPNITGANSIYNFTPGKAVDDQGKDIHVFPNSSAAPIQVNNNFFHQTSINSANQAQWDWTSINDHRDGAYPGWQAVSWPLPEVDRFHSTNSCYSVNDALATEDMLTFPSRRNALYIRPDGKTSRMSKYKQGTWVFRAPYGDLLHGTGNDPTTGVTYARGYFGTNFHTSQYRAAAYAYNPGPGSWTYLKENNNQYRAKTACFIVPSPSEIGLKRFSWQVENSLSYSFLSGADDHTNPSLTGCAMAHYNPATLYNLVQRPIGPHNQTNPNYSGRSTSKRAKIVFNIACVVDGGCNNNPNLLASASNINLKVEDDSKLYLYRNTSEADRGAGAWTRSNLLDGSWNRNLGYINWSAGDPGLGIATASEGGPGYRFGGVGTTPGGGIDLGEESRDLQGCTNWDSNPHQPMTAIPSYYKSYRLSRKQTNPSSPYQVPDPGHNTGVCASWFYKNRDLIDTKINGWQQGVNNVYMCATKFSGDALRNGPSLYGSGTAPDVNPSESSCFRQEVFIDNQAPYAGISINPVQTTTAGKNAKWIRGVVAAITTTGEIDNASNSGLYAAYAAMAIRIPGGPNHTFPEQTDFWYPGSPGTGSEYASAMQDYLGVMQALNYAGHNGYAQGLSNIGANCSWTPTNLNGAVQSPILGAGFYQKECAFNSAAAWMPEGTGLDFRVRAFDNAQNASLATPSSAANNSGWKVDNTPPKFYPNQNTGADEGYSGIFVNNNYKNTKESPWIGSNYQVKFRAVDGVNGSGIPGNIMYYCKSEANTLAAAEAADKNCRNTSPGQPGGPVAVTSSNSLNDFTVNSNTADGGAIIFSVKAVDLAGNFKGQDSNGDYAIDDPQGVNDLDEGWAKLGTLRVDRGEPTINAVADPEWRNTSQAVNITSNDGSGSGIRGIEFNYQTGSEFPNVSAIAAADYQSSGWPANYASALATATVGSYAQINSQGSPNYNAVFTEGGYRQVNARARDNAGNVSQPVPLEIKIDKIKPSVEMNAVPVPAAAYINLTATGTDPNLNGQAQSGLSTGYFQICQGNSSQCTTDSNNWININQEVANYKCSASFNEETGAIIEGVDVQSSNLDGNNNWNATYQGCRMRVADSNLIQTSGDYSFRFIGFDNAGNQAVSSIQTLDISALCDPSGASTGASPVVPAPVINMSPPAVSNNTSPSFTFTSSPGYSFQCKVDEGAWSNCSSPHQLSGLSDGEHVFRVRSVDAVGNRSLPASRTFSIDTVAPDTIINTSPSEISGITEASFSFASTEGGSSFTCRLDSGAWSSCDSPRYFSNLSEGQHTFSVRATDPANNTDSSPATFVWTVDSVAPNTFINSGPSGISQSKTAEFTFSASKTATFECRLDNEEWKTCSSPIKFVDLSEGEHTLSVRATSVSGNVDQTPATRTWTVDSLLPDVTIVSGPEDGSVTTNKSATFVSQSTKTAVSGGIRHTLKRNGSNYGTQPTQGNATQTYSNLPDGEYEYTVNWTDASGNVDPTPPTRSWTIDTTAPTVAIAENSGPPQGELTNNTDPEFIFTASENNVTFECRIWDGFNVGDFEPCSSPVKYTDKSALGIWSFQVRVIDAAGNVSEPAYRSWLIDTVVPVVNITEGPAQGSVSESRNASFTFTSSKDVPLGGAYYYLTRNGEPYEDDFSGMSKSFTNLPDGEYEFTIHIVDYAGNYGTASRSWIVSGPPPIEITSSNVAQGSRTNQVNPSFSFASEPGNTFECRIFVLTDIPEFTPCTSPMNYTGKNTNTTWFFQVRAKNSHGVYSDPVAVRGWTVDTVAPTVNITAGPAEGSFTKNRNASFTATSSEPVAVGGVAYILKRNGAVYEQDFSGLSKSFTNLPDGEYEFIIQVQDEAGNASTATRSWTIDNIAPTVTITGTPTQNTVTTRKTTDLTFTSNESLTLGGVAHVLRRDGSIVSSGSGGYTLTGTNAVNFSFSNLQIGLHILEVTMVDRAGNARTVSREWEVVSVVLPTIEITSSNVGHGSVTNQVNPSFSFSSSPGNTFECRIYVLTDIPEFTPCTSPMNYTNKSINGIWFFQVRAKDSEGNYSHPVASRNWTVDTVSPTLTLTSGPAANSRTNNRNPSFGVSSTETIPPGGLAYTLIRNGSTYASGAGGNPQTFSNLPEGNYTYSSYVVDRAGNQSNTVTRSWTIDLTAPTASFSSGPAQNSRVNSTSAAFTFASSESGSTFECRLDSSPWSNCNANTSFYSLSQGSHTVQLRATDQAGNVSAVVSRTWIVDTVAPVVAINSANVPFGGNTQQVNPSFTFSSEAGATFECRIWDALKDGLNGDGVAFTPCTSPMNYTGKNKNTIWLFQVQATDQAGNVSTPDLYYWTVDTVSPTLTITSGPANGSYSNNRNPSFGVSSTKPIPLGGLVYSLTRNGAAYSSGFGGNPQTFSNLPEGNYTYSTYVVDEANNQSNTVTRSWTIDFTPPVVTITGGPEHLSTITTADTAFQMSSNEPGGAVYQCSLVAFGHNPNWTECNYGTSHIILGLTNGYWTFSTRTIDRAGNISDTVARVFIKQ